MTPGRISQPPGRFPPALERFEGNPILRPEPAHWWESKAVFNPAAIYEGGKVHILYRAIGERDVSVLGYASSSDGTHILERLAEPAYIPREPFEGITSSSVGIKASVLSPFESGGGALGGCEDPRMTRIGDRVYLTYVAYDGHSHPRVALSSIHIHDFLHKRWNWKKPVLISPPNVVDKNACILPEKINGRYVIFHRIFPDILIDYVDDLDFDGKTKWLQGHYKIPAKSSSWDSRKVAAGPPPIKTKDGWLFIYHAIDERDELRYKIGAMLLDLKEPTRVLARTAKPILEPVADYENEGLKSGVVYPCGAVVLNERLFVYYGGADMVVCVASANMDEFMSQLSYETEGAQQSKPVAPPLVQVIHPVVPPSGVEAVPEEHVSGYCVVCRKKMEMKNPRHTLLKNKRHAVQGRCPGCGAKMFLFGRGR